MDAFRFEILKLFGRKYVVILLAITTVSFPLLIAVLGRISVTANEISEGLYIETMAFYILKISQTYFFLPVYILILCGHEFLIGHVNRVVFLRSRSFYFTAKIIFCLIISVFFTFLGIIALFLSIEFSGFTSLYADILFYIEFTFTILVTSFLFSILLLSIVFVFRSPIVSYVFFVGWDFCEGIVFLMFNRLHNIKLIGLPLHSIRLLYDKDLSHNVESYRRIFSEFEFTIVTPFLLVGSIIIILYLHFKNSDLKSLSD